MPDIILPRATNSDPADVAADTNKPADTDIPAVDANGNPIVAPDPVVPPATTTEFTSGEIVDIDGIEYTIDDEGNAVGSDGTKKTKAELATLNTVADDATTTSFDSWDDIRSELGYQPVDEQGNPIEYTKDKEGLKKYTIDSFRQYRQSIENDVLTNFFNTHKDLHQVYVHKVRTGTIEDFNAQPVWEDFDLASASEQELEQLYRSYRRSLGDDKDTIEELVAAAKTNKNLAVKATTAKEHFVKLQNAEIAEAKKLQDEAERKEANDVKEYWSKVKGTIDAGKVVVNNNELVIPEVIKVTKNGTVKQYSRADFYNYLTAPKSFEVNKQKVQATQYQYDKYLEDSARTHNHDVLDAFKTFVGGDLSQLIKRAIDTNKVNEVKRRLTSKVEGSSAGGGSTLILPVKKS